MQFETKQKRNFLINIIYGLIPDTIIGIGVASFTDSGLSGFIFTVIGLQIVYFFKISFNLPQTPRRRRSIRSISLFFSSCDRVEILT